MQPLTLHVNLEPAFPLQLTPISPAQPLAHSTSNSALHFTGRLHVFL